jgi:putative membrane protein
VDCDKLYTEVKNCRKGANRLRIFSVILVLLIVLLGVSFSTLNAQSVDFNYYINSRTMPLSVLMAGTFSVGCFIGIIVCLWILVKVKVKNFQLEKRLKLAEKEIENLRAIPLQDIP